MAGSMLQQGVPSVRLGLFCAAVCPFLVNGWVNAHIAARPLWYWAFEILTWLVIPLAAFAIARRDGGPTLSALGYSDCVGGQRNLDTLLVLCLLAAACAPALYSLCEWLGRALFGAHALFSYAEVIPAHGVLRVLVVLWFGLSAGFVEETLYRAYAWHLASHCRHPRLIYLVLGPFLFALAHWEGGAANLVASWLYGLVAALAYLGLRNLWPLVVGHCTTDFLAFG